MQHSKYTESLFPTTPRTWLLALGLGLALWLGLIAVLLLVGRTL